MASFQEHLNQALKNINVLEQVNNKVTSSYDWQVTICFYSALHLANAHITNKIDEHYRTHGDVDKALNFYSTLNLSKFSEDAYIAYKSLQVLSKRSRYLCSESHSDQSTREHLTFEKHLGKAIRHLHTIQTFFNKE